MSRHVVCVVRHAQAVIKSIHGVLTDIELTRHGEEQSERIARYLASRFETRDIHLEMSKEKRAEDTARLISASLGIPATRAHCVSGTISPFYREMEMYLGAIEQWRGIHVLIAHRAFLDAAYQLTTSEKHRFERIPPVPIDFPYGSMVIIDVDTRTVEFVSNDQPR